VFLLLVLTRAVTIATSRAEAAVAGEPRFGAARSPARWR
jgi:hypothetical protein